jgi:hypothetical protein
MNEFDKYVKDKDFTIGVKDLLMFGRQPQQSANGFSVYCKI